jgi:DNA polymerase I-like protein with 3'-5' exonuclease and polymerase domains
MYDTMGTITGRILTIDPQLQRLSRKYRGVIKARTGYKTVYVDFSQFEPNIMSSISKDSQLVALCNQGDLYEQLAIRLCGSPEHRKITKLMFLAYSYGKRVSSLSDFLVGIIGSKEEADLIIQTHFLPLFEGIEAWKSKIAKDLLEAGKIGTLLGNYRYRMRTGELGAKEQRWAVSQVVQGTGSLILKKLIIMLTRTLPEAFVLLPMHDALLMEVPEDRSAEVTNELLNCCRKTFSEVCPLVFPVVCEKAFAE